MAPPESLTHVVAMRVLGVILIALGGYLLARGLTYRTSREVVQVGDFKATVRQEHALPRWTGGIAIVAGIVLVFARRRRPT